MYFLDSNLMRASDPSPRTRRKSGHWTVRIGQWALWSGLAKTDRKIGQLVTFQYNFIRKLTRDIFTKEARQIGNLYSIDRVHTKFYTFFTTYQTLPPPSESFHVLKFDFDISVKFTIKFTQFLPFIKSGLLPLSLFMVHYLTYN